MITAPLTAPRPGLILFSDRLALMVRIKQVTKDGFTFHVLNGAWDGIVAQGQARIDNHSHGAFSDQEPDPGLGESDFAQVVSVTRNEHGAWYMDRATGSEKLINRTVTQAPVLTTGTDEDDPQEDLPDPVYEVTLRVTVLGQAENARELENWVAGLSLEELGRQMDEGELIGASQVIGTSELPAGEIRTRLEEIGNDGSFFQGVGPADKTVSVARQISDLRDQQGWNDGSMEHLAAAFIREAGLERAFLAHLKGQAGMENGYVPEGYEP
jgi:hypothetical protein